MSGAPGAGRAVCAAVVGLAAALAIAACATNGRRIASWELGRDQKNEITALWTQIRAWRREARMDVEPPLALIQSLRGQTVRQAASACPDAHVPPRACTEICDLADAICDNAANICGIAGELGPDPWAREKCDSAKASCKEAKQRCCSCDVDDPATPSSAAEPAP